eukprot:CAMPEP_0197695848 /NCGR_PEP_ID=MMETSP1338-20131121/115765_1 /TAXON_ID=43686 ORGANISM="Pelagodinium beii, Strain RCC1491" /NCGR_SAMPLE_ID=MMETSP1338 /ASSEMBLY_ACC=CAM_ASM_000754 /LENGTH=1522 /DNA_ID=CAMNT_0043278887 /DNA_START=140 /DNA_END=4708 /DNA_ORIENTATION=-
MKEWNSDSRPDSQAPGSLSSLNGSRPGSRSGVSRLGSRGGNTHSLLDHEFHHDPRVVAVGAVKITDLFSSNKRREQDAQEDPEIEQEENDEEDEEEEDQFVEVARPKKRMNPSMMRRALKSLATDQNRYEDYAYNGLFIDYLVRNRNKKCYSEGAKRMLDPQIKGRTDVAAYQGGEQVVATEKLESLLRNIITICYKEMNHPDWVSTGNEFKKHAVAMLKLKREERHLNIAVEETLALWKRRVTVKGNPEPVEQRRYRLKEFWMTMHSTHKLQDLPPLPDDALPKEPPKKSRREGRASKSGKSDPDTSSRPSKTGKKMAPQAWYAHTSDGEGSRQESWKLPKDDVWKLRASRTVCSRGGSRASSRTATTGTAPISPTLLSFPSLSATSSSTGDLRGSFLSSTASTAGRRNPRSITSGSLGSLQDWGFAPSSPMFDEFKQVPDRYEEASTNRIGKHVSKILFSGQAAKEEHRPLVTMRELAWAASAPELGAYSLEKAKIQAPYQKGGGGHAIHTAQSPQNRYLRACDANYLVPNLIPFCTGHSSKLDASNCGLTDQDLLAVTDMCQSVTKLQEISLGGNPMLTGQSLVAFLTQLNGPWVNRHLHMLSLRGCLQKATVDGVKPVLNCITDLVVAGAQQLRVLDLSGIPFDRKSHLPLSKAVHNHPNLVQLSLAETRLGYDHPDAHECVSSLSTGQLEILDLGWNAFDEETFRLLGIGMAKSMLKILRVPSCACESKISGSSTVEYLLEQLRTNKSVTELDVSLNRINFKGATVMEATLWNNSSLSVVDLSHNPLSMLGFRSVLRWLGQESSAFTYFECVGCSICNSNLEATAVGDIIYNETNPSGRYHLNLEHPYDRALLRLLYRSADRYKLQLDQAFLEVTPGYKHASKGPDGFWPIPEEGEVDFRFTIAPALDKGLEGVADENWGEVLHRSLQMTRIHSVFKKQVAIAVQFKKMQMQPKEQITMLEALSKDFHFTHTQFLQLCRVKPLIADVAMRLLPNLVGGDAMRFLSLLRMPSQGDYLRFMKQSRNLMHFNVNSPTGRYKLDLSNCCDFSVAEQIKLLDRWECCIDQKRGAEITSQNGLRSHARNELYQSKPLSERLLSDFILPEHGELQFDYVSSKAPRAGAMPLNQKAFDRILLATQQAECNAWASMEALRTTSDQWYLSCRQLRAFMGLYQESSVRAELFVCLAQQVVDIWNEKVFRSRFTDAKEFQELQKRLGNVLFFPFIQPEETAFQFDLSYYDQRLAAYLLIKLAHVESVRNMTDYSILHESGEVDQLIMGVPESWQRFENIDTSGVFSVSYTCSADDRSFRERKSLLEKWSNRTCCSEEQEVMWWSSIQACSVDVLEFVEFLNSNYGNVWKAFDLIDRRSNNGLPGNGEITLPDFKQGIKELKCKKFSGEDEAERITAIFRYLDPQRGGTISKGEWSVLEQIFREVNLSVKEFVDFLERNFGTDLDDAWDRMDIDGSGEIDFNEWQETLTALGFFGPATPIYAYLDKDDDGTISRNELHALADYQDPDWKL